jgi:magnesium chelatase family protein
MPVARTRGAIVVGVEGVIVEVEADVAAGLVGMTIVGLPDKAVGESRDRARTAVVNSGLEWPQRKITIALLPTDLHKRGSGLDLSVAVAVLAATEQVPVTAAAACVVMGELGLDGRVRVVDECIVVDVVAVWVHDCSCARHILLRKTILSS